MQYRWPNDTLLRNYTYPEDPAYRRNAADIVEVRVQPQPDATAFRVTMNTMTDPELLGLTHRARQLRRSPHGPARRQHGHAGGEVRDRARRRGRHHRRRHRAAARRPSRGDRRPRAPSGGDPRAAQRVGPAGAAAASPRRPGCGTARATRTWCRRPPPTRRTRAARCWVTRRRRRSSTPRSASHEPFEAPYRNNDQQKAIADGDLSPFFADVDFGKLAGGVDDESGVPTTRVHDQASSPASSRRSRAAGCRATRAARPPASGSQQGGIATGAGAGSGDKRPSLAFGWPCRDDCVPDLPGRLQRYMVYVPEQAGAGRRLRRRWSGPTATRCAPATTSPATRTCTASSPTGRATRRWSSTSTSAAPTTGATARAAPRCSRRSPTRGATTTWTPRRPRWAGSPAARTPRTSSSLTVPGRVQQGVHLRRAQRRAVVPRPQRGGRRGRRHAAGSDTLTKHEAGSKMSDAAAEQAQPAGDGVGRGERRLHPLQHHPRAGRRLRGRATTTTSSSAGSAWPPSTWRCARTACGTWPPTGSGDEPRRWTRTTSPTSATR